MLESSALAPSVRIIGRYALHDAIASGGMATVHLGRLLGPVGFSRTVAIKKLHAQFAQDPEFVSMFLDEARLAARIRHPSVVPTLDVVATAGELFLVMDYVHGDSLSKLARAARDAKTRMPQRIVSAVMSNALHGLHAAHEAKSEHGTPLHIVHRDVSPQNILVGTDGVARVLDFGVAKATGRLQQTAAGSVKGKLAYMAPEQLADADATRQSDVYSAGVVLWELLVGERLFVAQSEAALVAKVMAGAIIRPSDFVSNSLASTLVVDDYATLRKLDEVVLRALHRDPGARYASARDMAIALEDALPPATSSQVGAWVEKFASATLSQRANRVAEVESGLHVPPLGKQSLMDRLNHDDAARLDSLEQTPPRPPSSPSTTQVAPVDLNATTPDAIAPAVFASTSQVSSISVATPVPAPANRRAAMAIVAVLAGFIVAMAGGGLMFALRKPTRASLSARPETSSMIPPASTTAPIDSVLAPLPSAAPTEQPLSATSAEADSPEPPVTASADATAVAPSASLAASAQPPAPTPAKPSEATLPTPAPKKPHKPAVRAPSAADCFITDEAGIKRLNTQDPRCLL